MKDVSRLLEGSNALAASRAALAPHETWVVGGTVRDLLLGRPVDDVDLVVTQGAEAAARDLARAIDGHVFQLSERFGAWRVIERAHRWQADVTPARGGSIEADLGLRDFTINAIAAPLDSANDLIDPHGGRVDLERGLIRVVSERSYRDDPLRTLRMARLACELGFEVEGETRRLAAASAAGLGGVAPERSFYELRRLVVSAAPLRGLELLDESGGLATLLPELEAMKDVEQNPYHHLDVWGHSLAVLDRLVEMESTLEEVFGDHAEAVTEELGRALGDGLTRGGALRLAALLHDVGKPRTRRIAEDGRILFLGHDELGAEMIRAICERLRTSGEVASYLAEIARHHLRLGFLVHQRPLTRHHVYSYLRSCEPVELEVTVLSAADRLATRGERTRAEAVEAHLELARQLAAETLAWRASGGAPRPPVSGDDLISELGIEPGPRVGALLEHLREAAFTGEVTTRQAALERARRALRASPSGGTARTG